MTRNALIVDDDPSVQKSLGRLLKLKGFTVTAASNVAEALAALNGAGGVNGIGNHHEPAVVVLDLNLPDGSGADVLTVLRARSSPSRVAVWTGGAPLSVLQQIEPLHPDATFHKPHEVEKLIAWLEEVEGNGKGGSA
jgi:DNA-binding response OmpR family regulator